MVVPGQRDLQFVARQPVSQEARNSQLQIVMSPYCREMYDPPPPYASVALGYQTLQVGSYTSVATPASNDIVEFQTVSSGAHEEQTQIVQLPDSSSEVESPPPPYEAVASGYQNVQLDLPPPFGSVPVQAFDSIVEFQTVSSEAQGDSDSLAMENTPPPYEDVVSGYS